jgi:PadR family transcriptional regulator PadR
MPNKETDRAQFLRGTLDLMILQSLETIGPMHGYAIAARLEQVSRGALLPNMGTLYPGLMRLEQRASFVGPGARQKTTAKRAFTR